MNVIHKYEILMNKEFLLDLPLNAEVLHVARQGEKPFMWIMHAEDFRLTSSREFYVLGTGWEVPKDAVYIATWHEPEFGLVWHLFEKVTP